MGKTCHTAVQVTVLMPAVQPLIYRQNIKLGHLKPVLQAAGAFTVWGVASAKPCVEINDGSPPGDGWWEYITTNKCLPRCRRRQSLTCWLLSTREGSRGEQSCPSRFPPPCLGACQRPREMKGHGGWVWTEKKAKQGQCLCNLRPSYKDFSLKGYDN